MQLPDSKPLEEAGSSFETTSTRISADNIGYIFNLLAKYSRPIESIVREITSNCFDSHIEAGVTDPVIVRFGEDENGEYISFIDVGVGLSKERINNIYLDVGNSTKRDDNKQIGSYGIGSKSPFSYTESFYITTHFGGITYEYMYYRKSTNSKPDLSLLLEYEEERKNGTEIKIYFKHYLDKSKFKDACKTQLCYFDNVFFDISDSSLNNFYTIYEGKHFKFRKDSFTNVLHLCVGKVAYPINFNSINAGDLQNIPIALKFEIGDLPIEPKRESLEYVLFTDKNGRDVTTEQVIEEKIALVKEELAELYKKQSGSSTEDLYEYMTKKDSYPRLLLGDHSIDVSFIPDINRYAKRLVFKPFQDFEGTIPYNPLLEYRIVGEYKRGKIKLIEKEHWRRLTLSDLRDEICIRYPATGKFSKVKNEYILHYYKELDLKRYTDSFNIIESVPISVSNLYFNIGLSIRGKTKERKTRDFSKTNLLKQVLFYRDYMRDYVCADSLDYENLEVPKDFIDDYRRKNNVGKVKIKKEEDDVVVYDYLNILVSARKQYIKPKKELRKFSGIVLYGTNEDELYLEGFADLFLHSKYANQVPRYKKGRLHKYYNIYNRIRIYKVADRNVKYFKYKNCVHVQDFMSDNKVFKKIATAITIEDKCDFIVDKPVTYNKQPLRVVASYINPKVQDAVTEVEHYVRDYGGQIASSRNIDISIKFRKEVVALAELNGLIEKDKIDLTDRIIKYFDDAELLPFINFDTTNSYCILAVLNYFKLLGKAVDRIFDEERIPQWEKELIEDSIKKLVYNNTILREFKIDRRFDYYSIYGESNYAFSSNYRNQLATKFQTIGKIRDVSRVFYEILIQIYYGNEARNKVQIA